MTTRNPSPRFTATFAVPDDNPRAAAIARSFKARTLQSPYLMTRAKARKAALLYRTGWSACSGGYMHPRSRRVFLLADAVACAEILEGIL